MLPPATRSVRRVAILILLLGGALPLHAAEQPARVLGLQASCAPVFSDRAVFQRDMPVPVWGWSLPGADVTVSFGRQSKTTSAAEDGGWRVVLDAMPADQLEALDRAPAGRTLTVVTELDGKRATRTFEGILIGEVWLCSGQSNMAAKVRHNHANQDPQDNLLESNFPAIRHISAPGDWQEAVPGSVGEFTRVGFCFARRIQRELKVPVGLVNACRGGSRIESWMRLAPQDLPDEGKQRKEVEYGGLYRERIVPLIGYAMRGALWYQGEANASEGHSYLVKMKALIEDWRASWGQGKFPFYFVQLAGIGHSPGDDPAMGDGRARIREAQRQALDLENTGMAVAIDIGADREHPPNKVEVGIRLAHWALHHDYGRAEILPSGPLLEQIEIEGATVRVSFEHADGLMIATKENYAPPVPAPRAKLRWLSIQSADGTWHWAEGKIEGETLLAFSEAVPEPVAIRYAYTNRPGGALLYNRQGLPAAPFSASVDAPGPALGKPDTVKVAAVQISGYDKGDLPRDGFDPVEGIVPHIHRAGKDGAQLVVFPEYVLGRIRVPGPETAGIAAAATANQIYVIIGCWEVDEDGSYANTALLFGRDGKIIGKYHKTHAAVDHYEGTPPWSRPPGGKDRDWFIENDPEWTMKKGSELPVFDLDFGTVGIMTCYDGWFPEPPRILSLRGAELIVWINGRRGAVEDFIVKSVMFQSHVGMVTSNQAYGSGTMIADWPAKILQRCPDKTEAYISGVIDLKRIRQRRSHSRNFQQRRPELYDLLSEPLEVHPGSSAE